MIKAAIFVKKNLFFNEKRDVAEFAILQEHLWLYKKNFRFYCRTLNFMIKVASCSDSRHVRRVSSLLLQFVTIFEILGIFHE